MEKQAPVVRECVVKCSAREKSLLEQIRAIGYGEIKIIIKENEPVMIEKMKESIKL